MNNNLWIYLGPLSDFPATGHICLNTDGADGFPGTALVVLNVEGELYALENRCPHAGLPIGDGERAGMTLTCPYHGYTYHIKTGKNIDFPDEERRATTFPIHVEGGRVQVQLASDEAKQV